MPVKSGQVWTGNFSTVDATGSPSAATVGPVGVLYVTAVAVGDIVTISGADPYKFSVTLPALAAGQSVGMYITATVAGVAKAGFVAQDIADTKLTSDLQDLAAGALMGLADDAITSAKFDESSAFPLKAADALSTQVMRVGADGDTAETLSDQLDVAQADLDTPAQYKADVSGLATSAALAAVSLLVDDLETRLTALRAGYLDNLSAGPVALASALTTVAANVTTLLARIGAFTGTGVNTILGFLKAMASKIATLPSDIGGTFSPATDSLEALRDNEVLASNAAIPSGSDIARRRGDGWTILITGMGSLAGRSKLWFTLKNDREDTDAQAVFQIAETTGLLYLNGATAVTPTDGSLTVTSEALGNITVVLKAAATKTFVVREGMYYDVQQLVSGIPTTLSEGTFDITADVTRAVS